jgi:hypothetical protein
MSRNVGRTLSAASNITWFPFHFNNQQRPLFHALKSIFKSGLHGTQLHRSRFLYFHTAPSRSAAHSPSALWSLSARIGSGRMTDKPFPLLWSNISTDRKDRTTSKGDLATVSQSDRISKKKKKKSKRMSTRVVLVDLYSLRMFTKSKIHKLSRRRLF